MYYCLFSFSTVFMISMSRFISSTGLLALSTAPETAIPDTPVCMMSGMSAAVIPPMAIRGMLIPCSAIFVTMSQIGRASCRERV